MGSIESGKFEGDSRQETILPEYSDKIFEAIVDCVPNDFINDKNQGLGDSKEKLDILNIWWKEQDKVINFLERFSIAPTLPNIPPLEVQEAQKRFQALRSSVDIINVAINTLLESPIKRNNIVGIFKSMYISSDKYGDIKCIAEHIQEYNKKNRLNSQIIAVCEGISEGNTQDLTEGEIRQRIAQYAWEELIDLIPYAKIDNTYLTTKDELEVEKDDIKSSLEGSKWSLELTKKEKDTYNRYMEQMRKGEFRPTVIEYFETLYKYTKGNIPEDISAIYILELQEAILTGLYREGALKLENK